MYAVKECFYFILLHVAVQFSQRHLLKRLSFHICIVLPPLLVVLVCGLISGCSVCSIDPVFLFLCQYHTVLMTIAL